MDVRDKVLMGEADAFRRTLRAGGEEDTRRRLLLAGRHFLIAAGEKAPPKAPRLVPGADTGFQVFHEDDLSGPEEVFRNAHPLKEGAGRNDHSRVGQCKGVPDGGAACRIVEEYGGLPEDLQAHEDQRGHGQVRQHDGDSPVAASQETAQHKRGRKGFPVSHPAAGRVVKKRPPAMFPALEDKLAPEGRRRGTRLQVDFGEHPVDGPRGLLLPLVAGQMVERQGRVGPADGDGDAAEECAAGVLFREERAVRAEVEGEDPGAGTQRDKSRPVIDLHKTAGQGHAAFREDEEGRAPRYQVGDLLQGIGVHRIDLDGMAVARKGAEEELSGHCPVHDDLERQLEVRPDKQAVEEGGVVGDHDEPGCVPWYAL